MGFSLRKNKVSKKVLIIGSSSLIILLAGLFVWAPWRQSGTPATEPSFSAALPSNRSIEDLGGWQKLTPPNGDPAFVFTDKLDGVSISVSQQELPSSLQSKDGSKVTELAKSYNATNTLDVDGTKVYIGTSAQGPQSVIFTKNNLLILIKSQAVIKDASWISYVASLG